MQELEYKDVQLREVFSAKLCADNDAATLKVNLERAQRDQDIHAQKARELVRQVRGLWGLGRRWCMAGWEGGWVQRCNCLPLSCDALPWPLVWVCLQPRRQRRC
jgi:hypothetical protein